MRSRGIFITVIFGVCVLFSQMAQASYFSITNGYFALAQKISYEGSAVKYDKVGNTFGWDFETKNSTDTEEESFWSSQNLTTLEPKEKIITPNVFGVAPPGVTGVVDSKLICFVDPPKNAFGNATGVHMYTQQSETDILTTKELQINGTGGGENLEYTLSFDLLKEYTGTRSYGSIVNGVQEVSINNLTARNVNSNETLTVSLLAGNDTKLLFSGNVKDLLNADTNTITTISFWLDSSNAADYYKFQFTFGGVSDANASYVSMTNVSLNRVVPEPQTYAMLLGVCAVGIVWKCRKRAKIHR